MTSPSTLLWFRQDLRTRDLAGLVAAAELGERVIPCYVLDTTTPGQWAPGGASRWWLHHSLASLDRDISALGGTLVLRQGSTAEQLRQLIAQTGALALPAEPWSARQWFFNPFGWQLLFFTGFAFMRGWIPKPPVTPVLFGLAAFIVVANVPLSNIGVREFGFDWAREWRIENRQWISKTDFGLLRYVQFLALAYVCWVIAGDKGNRIRAGAGAFGRVWNVVLQIILKVGQQSLAVFVVSIFVARFNGFAMDVLGRETGTVLAVNAFGCGCLILTAYLAGWFKTTPWKPKEVR